MVCEQTNNMTHRKQLNTVTRQWQDRLRHFQVCEQTEVDFLNVIHEHDISGPHRWSRLRCARKIESALAALADRRDYSAVATYFNDQARHAQLNVSMC